MTKPTRGEAPLVHPVGPVSADEPAPAQGPDSPDEAAPTPRARLGVKGWLRWVWRQLTSMRNALIMLLLLALGAVPGSFLPQRPQDPAGVARYLTSHPTLGPWMDRAGLFDVFASGWFTAIYVLLFISLVGCIVPRTAKLVRELRAGPAPVPGSLRRHTGYTRLETDAAPEVAIDRAARALRGFRLRLGPGRGARVRDGSPAGRALRAGGAAEAGSSRLSTTELTGERGYLREIGNLVFHVSLLGVLVALGIGKLYAYQGQTIVVEDETVTNSRLDYDTFVPGRVFGADALQPYTLRLDSMHTAFTTNARADDFVADVTLTEPGSTSRSAQIRVNHPLSVAGQRVYLMGNGFAPRVTVRDADGAVVFSGAVPFVPQDAMYTSTGVVKVPDVPAGTPQLGFEGSFLPTAATPDAEVSAFPQPTAPLLVLDVYAGDLGLDSGVPQNVYELDTVAMERVSVDDDPLTVRLAPGQSAQLPDGLGSIEFAAEVPRYAALEMRHDPGSGPALVFVLTGIAGLIAMLFVQRRRVWVRARYLTPPPDPDGAARHRTVVEVAGLGRASDAGVALTVERVATAVMGNETTPNG